MKRRSFLAGFLALLGSLAAGAKAMVVKPKAKIQARFRGFLVQQHTFGQFQGLGLEFKDMRTGEYRCCALEIQRGSSVKEVADSLRQIAGVLEDDQSQHWALGQEEISKTGKVVNETVGQQQPDYSPRATA